MDCFFFLHLLLPSQNLFFSSRSYVRARFSRDQTLFVVSDETRETAPATLVGKSIGLVERSYVTRSKVAEYPKLTEKPCDFTTAWKYSSE